jgi:hypothetical protein
MAKQILFTQTELKLLMAHTIAYAIAVLALVLSIKKLIFSTNYDQQSVILYGLGLCAIFLIVWLHYKLETVYFKRFYS